MRYLQQKPDAKKVKLDIKDRKIISLLGNNARLPLTQLSKKVGLSRDAVAYRVKNYEKRGLVQGYRTMINISEFGYNNYHLFIKLNNPSDEIQKKLVDKLVKYPFVRAVIKFIGGFDFEIALVAKNLEDLDKITEKIMNDFSDFIQNHDILIFSKLFLTRTLPKSFSNDIEDVRQGKKKYKPDKKDIEILKLIGEDALMPLYDIGGEVGISADSVAYRIKKMRNSRIINKFFPVINFNSLGYNSYVVLMNIASLDAEKGKKLKDFLLYDKNVFWAVKTVGKYNMLAYFLVKEVEDLQSSLFKLRGLFPGKINQHEVLIAYEEYKYTYFPKGLF